MKWVEFTKTVQFESEGRAKGPVFDAGSRHQFEDHFADRWVRRDAAVVVDGPHAVPKPVAEEPSPPPVDDPPPEPVDPAPPAPGSKKQKARA